MIGSNLQVVADRLVEHLIVGTSGQVLDVGAGTGNAAIAAARAGHDVTALDLSEELLEQAQGRAEREGLKIRCVRASAEHLPFPDASFDAAISTFGVMFAPDQKRASAELLRVTGSGGTIALANWSPEGVFGKSGATIAQFLPPSGATKPPSPALWGRASHVSALFGSHIDFEFAERDVLYCYPCVDSYLDVLIGTYPPLINTMAKLDQGEQATLRSKLRDLYKSNDVGEDGRFVMPMRYLQAVGRVK